MINTSLIEGSRYKDLIEEGYNAAFRIGPQENRARPLAPYRLQVASSSS